MGKVIEMTSIEDWKELYEKYGDQGVLVFKHSTSCPISAEAYQEFNEYVAGQSNENITYAFVKVIEARPVSNQIAEDLQVKHASPQAILIKGKKEVWNTSHWHITQAALSEALQ